MPHISSGEGLQVTNFDQLFTYSNGYYASVETFSGGLLRVGVGMRSRGLSYEDLSMEEFIIEGRRSFHEGGAGFSSIIKKKQ